MSPFLRAEVRARVPVVAALATASFLFLLAVAATYGVLAGAQTIRFYGSRVPTLVSAFAGSTRSDVYDAHRYLAFGFDHPLC